MKQFTFLLILTIAFTACKNTSEKTETEAIIDTPMEEVDGGEAATERVLP